jgi:AcrR family transcriptional regulator
MIGQMPKADDQRPAGTRERILRATVELIVDIGWQRVTTRRVAARAGVNQALVHYHFGSIDRLIRQALVSALERELGEPTERLVGIASPGEGVRQLSEWLRTFDANSPMAVVSTEALTYATRDAELRAWLARLLSQFRAQLTDGITAAQGGADLRDDVPAAGLATLSAALMDGLIFHRLIDPQLSVAEVATTLDTMLRPDTTKGEREAGD